MKDGYAVTVTKWGEPILTIESECLSGAEHSIEDAEAIRSAGQSLCAFIGGPNDFVPTCVICCDDQEFCNCVEGGGLWQPGIECEHGYDACPICDTPPPADTPTDTPEGDK